MGLDVGNLRRSQVKNISKGSSKKIAMKFLASFWAIPDMPVLANNPVLCPTALSLYPMIYLQGSITHPLTHILHLEVEPYLVLVWCWLKGKYHCMADLLFFSVWIQLLCLCCINSSFTCLDKSKPVKQEVSCTVILPPMVSVLCLVLVWCWLTVFIFCRFRTKSPTHFNPHPGAPDQPVQCSLQIWRQRPFKQSMTCSCLT